MANSDNPNGFKASQSYHGGPPRVVKYDAAASQTIAVGDPVLLDSAGRITICVSNSSTELVGVAASAVTASAAGDDIYVFDDPEQIFESQCDGTPGLVAPYTTRGTSTGQYDIKGTTGIFEINDAGSTQDLIMVVGFHPDTDATLANPRVFCRINKHQLRHT